MPGLVLASTSRYRSALLERLQLPFACAVPDTDETRRDDEPVETMCLRLASEKAAAVSARAAGAWVIGSDQAASLDGVALGKPGEEARAVAQLHACSGRSVVFHTAVALHGPDGSRREHVDRTEVIFRVLGIDEIERYVAAERPLDCAGSFKCEGLGITLFRAIRSEDPTALIGLPLIALAAMLREAGFALP